MTILARIRSAIFPPASRKTNPDNGSELDGYKIELIQR